MAEPLLKRTLSRFKTKTESKNRDVAAAAPRSPPPQTHLKHTWTNQSPGPAQWEEPQIRTRPSLSPGLGPSLSPGLRPGLSPGLSPDLSPGLSPGLSRSQWVPRTPGLRAYLLSLDSSSRAWVLSSGKSPAPTPAQRPEGEEQIWYNPIPEDDCLEEQTGAEEEQTRDMDRKEKTEATLSAEAPEHSGGVSERMIDKLRSPATKLRRKLSLKSRREKHQKERNNTNNLPSDTAQHTPTSPSTTQDLPPSPHQQSTTPTCRKRPIRSQGSSRTGYHNDADSSARQQVISQKEESHKWSPAHRLTGFLTVHLQGLDHMTHRPGVSRCVSVVIQVDNVVRARTAAMTMTGPALELQHTFNIQLEQAEHLKVIILNTVSPDPDVKICLRTRLWAVGGVSLRSLFRGCQSQDLSLSLEPRGTLHLRLSLQAGEAVAGAMSQVFGGDLKTLVQRESSDKPVPLIIQKTVSEINRRGLKVEGLYRLCGSSSLKKQLRDWFETNSFSVDLRDCPDLHAITGVLKDYLRELPAPLITASLYEAINHAMTPDLCDPFLTPDPELTQRTVRLLHCLPTAQKETLWFLMDHLSLVARHSALNKMTAQNLAVCFGPVLFVQTDQWGCSTVQTDQWEGGGAMRSESGVDFKQHIEALHFLLQNWPVPPHHYLQEEEEVGGAYCHLQEEEVVGGASSPELRYRPRDRCRHRQAGVWSQYQEHEQQLKETEVVLEQSPFTDDIEAPFNCRLSLKDFDLLIQDFHRQLSNSICL